MTVRAKDYNDYYRLSHRWTDEVSLQILRRGVIVDSVKCLCECDELRLKLESGEFLSQNVVSSNLFSIDGRKEYLPLMLPSLAGFPIFRKDVIKAFEESSFGLQTFEIKCDDVEISENYLLIYVASIEGVECGNFWGGNCVLNSRKIGVDVDFFRLSEFPTVLLCSGAVYSYFSKFHYSEWGVSFCSLISK